MKKKTLGAKLGLNKKTITDLSGLEQIKGGYATKTCYSFNCASLMSQCLCNPSPAGTSPGTPCCPREDNKK